jgi:putative hydrolase of the HAD superfamily
MHKSIYSVIVFDLGKVLIPFSYDITIVKLNKIEKGLGEKFISFFKENYFIHRKFEKGEISEKEFLSYFINALENKVEPLTFADYYSNIFSINHEVASLLPKLKLHYKLVLLSNTDSLHYKYGYKDFDFLRYFDKLILSFEVGAVKPETKIYTEVENFTNQPPHAHLFIDDIAEYVEAAKKIGWDAIQFLNYNNLLLELQKREIKLS